MIHQYRKDCPPEETVDRIRTILQNAKINVHESYYLASSDRLHAVRLDLSDLPGCGCNGKGTTRQLALASAYAELMERLQNRFMNGFMEYYGKMPKLEYSLDPPDQIHVPVHKYLKEQPGFLQWFIAPPIDNVPFPNDCEVICLPYFDFEKQCMVNLPYSLQFGNARWSLMLNRIGSTGMCAGNSFYEAVCQGLCEIMERYVMRQAFSDSLYEFPTVPLEVWADRPIYPVIQEIRAKGLTVMIKDCSLGGCFPVIGTVLIDNENKGVLRYGSDPNIDIALERCLTESFQGTLDKRYPKQRIPIKLSHKQFQGPPFFDSAKNRLFQFVRCVKNGSSEIPVNMLVSSFAKGLPAGFADRVNTSREAFEFVVRRIHDLGGKIFIRDVSFLSFPSFHVFVEGMSNALIPPISQGQVENMFKRSKKQSDRWCILHLSHASEQELNACILALETEWKAAEDDPLQYELRKEIPLFSWMAGLIISPSWDCSFLEQGDFLLSLLFHRIGDYKHAYKYLRDNLRRTGYDLQNKKYFAGVLEYFRLMADGWAISDIRHHLKEIYDEDLASEIIADLCDRKNAFQYMRLPDCGQCNKCPINKFCHYEDWLQVQNSVRSRLSRFNQAEQTAMYNSLKEV
ncbi:MAG: YcaO-like family protein [Clostridia bacterium]|nr:YcaO-like family protein [Clostridia bacterium]